MTRVYIETTQEHKDLLNYIVAYRKLRGRANAKQEVGKLIVAYAKQLATGMPEQIWRDNIIELINRAEET